MALTTIKTGGLADNSVTDAKVADAITVTGAQTGITQVGTLTGLTTSGNLIINHDGANSLRLGASADLQLYHNGSTSAVTNATGILYFWNNANANTVIGSNNVESIVCTGANTTFRGTGDFANQLTVTANTLINPSASTSSYLQFATGGTTYGYVGSESSIVSGGTAADMTIGASGDTNLTLTTNGAVRATLNSSGATFAGNITTVGGMIITQADGSNTDAYFGLGNDADYGQIGANEIGLWNVNNNDIIFGTNNNLRMTIQNDGKVGINCTPAEMLTVNGDTKLDGKIGIGKSPQSGYEFDLEASSGNANMRLKATGTNQGVRVDLDHHSGDKAEVHFYNGGHSSTAIVSNEITNGLIFKVGGTSGSSKVDAVKIESDGDMITRRIMPVSDGDRDLGDNTKSWRKVYTDNILFNGDTADANALDDYEEGTYTGTITFAAGSISIHPDNNALSYTKIGNTVHVRGMLACNGYSSASGASLLNLPFTSANFTDTAGISFSTGVAYLNGSAITNANYRLMYELNESSATARIFFSETASGSENLGDNHIADGSLIYVNITYPAG